MKNLYQLNKAIEKYSIDLQGVFSISDLQNLFNNTNNISLYRKIQKLMNENIIEQFCRGYYITQDFNPRMLAARINEYSYISFGTILSDELIIGSVPSHRITCVKTGKNRLYTHNRLTLQYLGIKNDLFFGYQKIGGINLADKEKALLDTLYYYQKGQIYSFNIYSDINYGAFDKKKIENYLTKYHNPKFTSFVLRLLNG